jgi:CBS domain-containing protein
MQVDNAMIGPGRSISAATSVAQAVTAMFRSHAFALSVFDANNSLVGVVSGGDLQEHTEVEFQEHRPGWWEFVFGDYRCATVDLHADGRSFFEIRTHGVTTSAEIKSLRAAVELMKRNSIGRAPVRMGDRVVAMVVTPNPLRVFSIFVLAPTPTHRANEADIRNSIVAMLDKRDGDFSDAVQNAKERSSMQASTELLH